MRFLLFALVAAASMAPLSADSAPMSWAQAVEWRNNGTVGSGFDDTTNALGAPEPTRNGVVNFHSLGRRGMAIFDFGTWFSGQAVVHETTWGDQATAGQRYPEKARIFVSADYEFGSGATRRQVKRQFTSVGRVKNGAAVFGSLIDLPEGSFRYLAVMDVSRQSSANGFDVNAIGVQSAPAPIPLPGALALMAGGFSALAYVSWRRRGRSS